MLLSSKLVLTCASSLLVFPVVTSAASTNGTGAVASNKKTSLQILFQNNLNSTDDVNHVPILLLDATERSQSAAACKAFGEQLLRSDALKKDKADFEKLLGFLQYTYPNERKLWVEDGALAVSKNGGYSIVSASRYETLSVLCTQSEGRSIPSTANEIAIKSNGNVYIGSRNQKAFQFLGVPFADKPIRFEYSRVYSARNQVIPSTAYPAQCAQVPSGSEDCLYLNIFSPRLPKLGSSRSLKPVLLWIHGGGFTGGNGSTDGSNLASREDIVFVSIQYRLSTLGFLAVPGTNVTGNYGIADQITALKWVRENIASFGGDPDKITLMGESAGAGSVRVLLGSPPAIGKYRGAISMSNLGGGVALGLTEDYSTTFSSYLTINGSYTASQALFSEAGCTQPTLAEQVACIRAVDAVKLVNLPTVARYVVQDGIYVNTEQLVVYPRNSSTAHIPVMFGIMADDGASFNNYPTAPVTSESTALQSSLGISSQYADAIISSGLFPLPNTGNSTLDAFNVSARVFTDVGFRCIDQATVYAARLSETFPSAYFYQFDRSIGAYDPNHVGSPPPSPGFPLGNPNLPYFKVHAGDVEFAFGTVPPDQIREPKDLWFAQLVSGYWSEFARSLQPNPSEQYLRTRGYVQTLQATRHRRWEAVGRGSSRGPIQRLDWPPSSSPYLELEQCKWLNYSLSYYIDSNRG